MTIQTPAHIQAFVDALGEDLTARMLMELGGSEVYFPAKPGGRGKVEDIIGRDNVVKLSGQFGGQAHRIPVARGWLIKHLRAKGLPIAEIARRLHVSDVTVRRALNGGPDPRQASLF